MAVFAALSLGATGRSGRRSRNSCQRSTAWSVNSRARAGSQARAGYGVGASAPSRSRSLFSNMPFILLPHESETEELRLMGLAKEVLAECVEHALDLADVHLDRLQLAFHQRRWEAKVNRERLRRCRWRCP